MIFAIYLINHKERAIKMFNNRICKEKNNFYLIGLIAFLIINVCVNSYASETLSLKLHRLFQENFVNPLIESNSDFTNKFNYIEEDRNSRKTWICCRHLSTAAKLNDVYSKCGQIYIFEGHIICQDCFNMIPDNSLIDIFYTGEAMTNVLFQETIVNSLYSINYETLISIKHHGWYETNLGNP